MIKQKTSHGNKDIKKAKATNLPKQIKPTNGVAKRTGGGPVHTKKGKSL